MGAQLGGGGGRGGHSRRRSRPMSDINVTPMVDVMLVLLVIFMVTAPMMTTGVPLELPKANAPALQQKSEEQPLEVSVKEDGTIWLMKTEVTMEELVPRLKAIAENRKDDRLYFRASSKVEYGPVAQVWAALVQGGFTKIAVVTDSSTPPPGVSGKPRG